MTDAAFVAAFEACTLPPAEFSHRNHVRLAWLYLRDDALPAALTRFIANLQRYATSLGAASKYHATITYAYLFLIHERMQREAHATFDAFGEANADLFERGLLLRYYEAETLRSELAQRAFVMPHRALTSISTPEPRDSRTSTASLIPA